MCGIIGGFNAGQAVQGSLLHGLQNMEYRGYDSSGICTLESNGCLKVSKASGKLACLREVLSEDAHAGSMGIGHTRWATHGDPSVRNAHPHCGTHIAVVHNGIIENHAELRRSLQDKGYVFASETDTEVVTWLLESLLADGHAMHESIGLLNKQLKGAYALGVLSTETPEQLWFVRKGSPLLVARGSEGYYIASDALAVAGVADALLYLDEGDWGCLTHDAVQVYDIAGTPKPVSDWQALAALAEQADKAEFEHYMLKEIHEQPAIMEGIMDAYMRDDDIAFPDVPWLDDAPLPDRMLMIACGTSYHAAMTARYWLERYLRIPVEVDVASEFRYRDPVIADNTWLITLSQSGETADTLEALRLFKARTPNNRALTMCNVLGSSLVRESDGVIALRAGVEIGVASTKAYTAQLAVLALFSMKLARRACAIPDTDWKQHQQQMLAMPQGMTEALKSVDAIRALLPLFANVHGALFLGRGPSYPLALEGALKLKEISYIHAEGYAAGEMKHGPIALIDASLPVVVIAPCQYHLDKVISNLHEVKARGAKVILLTDTDMDDYSDDVESIIALPAGDFFTAPMLASIPLQLLAYEVARAKGTDVDQPRNLAKSVTVE